MSDNKRKRGRPSLKKELDTDAVLEIAIQVFAEKGFEGTQLNVIAQRAGIAKSLMNYHFGNKEELWKKAIKKLMKKLMQRFDEIKSYFKDLEGKALFKAYNRQFIYFSAENPEFYKIVFHELCSQSERSEWIINSVLKPSHDLAKVLLLSNEGDEPVSKIPLPNLVSIALGAANVFFIHAAQMKEQYGINPLDKEQIERHADVVNELFFGK